ncbi:MAG: polysaccharide biosynthesis protein [Acidobacteriota bacterium]|nr:polysaccharide biosynthesis protein [Acidobacteriota bacterium]
MPQNSNGLWDDVLPVRRTISDSAIDHVTGKTVLITGAGGCIGSALAKKVLSGKPRTVVLLDHSEQSLYDLGRSLSYLDGAPTYRLIPGDAGDSFLIAALLEEYSPDVILHAAAYKHVPLMEANPFAALQNNAILTWQLAKAAAESGVPQLLLISTDKAANPRSILGASKRLAEHAVLRWSAPSKCYSAIRLVNVLGSTGSVVPVFLEQISRGGPLTITHPDAARYFMTLEDTVRLILAAAAIPDGGLVYIPKISQPMRIVELARELLRRTAGAATNTIGTEFTDLRQGEKIVEELFSAGESIQPMQHAEIQAVTSPCVSAPVFDRAILQLREIVQERHIAALLDSLCQLVPVYQPSSTLRAAAQIVS